jgi:hypothetical protein
MEYVPGEDLAEMMRNRGRAFHPLEVVMWADQILDVLEYLHMREPSVVHRDIKPSNLKLTDRGQIILLDFGLAKGYAGTQETDAESIIGYTPHYAPLEQIQGAGTGTRSDLYSLGATLYHLLTNEKPPDALTRVTEVIGSRPDPLIPASSLNEHVTKELAAILTQALALDTDARLGSATEMRRLLREASTTLSEITVEQAKDSLLPSQKAQLSYWTQFREFLSNRNSSLRTEAPRPQNYLGVWADRNFFRLAAFAHADIRQVGVSLSLNGPKAQARFNKLLEAKEEVESQLGYGLRWDDHQHISRYEIWVVLDDTDPTDPNSQARQYEWLTEKLEGLHRVFTQRFTTLPADDLAAAAASPGPPRHMTGDGHPLILQTSPLDVIARPEPAPFTPAPPSAENAVAHPSGSVQNQSGRRLPGHVAESVEGKSYPRASKWVLIVSVAAVVLFSTILAFMLLRGRSSGLMGGGAQGQATAQPLRDALINIADIKVTGELERPDSSAQLTPNSFIYLLAKINTKGRARVRGRLLVERVAGSRQGADIPGADTTVELLKSGTATFKFASGAGWRRGSYTAEVTLFGERGELKDVRSVSFVIP